jgi:hypothetical protein
MVGLILFAEVISMRVFLLALCCLIAVGCGGGKTAPVNGRVKFKDGSDVSVLAGHTVTFETDADRMSGYGDIQAEGTFKITTFSPDDGAMIGTHRISITPPEPPPDGPLPKPILHPKYKDYGTSGLTAEIKPGTNNVELELERAP